MTSVKFVASQARSINQYKNLRVKVLKCCAIIYFNRQWPKYTIKLGVFEVRCHILRYNYQVQVQCWSQAIMMIISVVLFSSFARIKQ